MASVIAHALLGGTSGWALSRRLLSRAAVVAGAVCAALPDLDSIGFRYGVSYGDWLGHRGFFHGMAFALLVGGAATAVSGALPRFKGSRAALFVFITACTASHGLLDAMTDGGLGVAFFSPFSNERYFLPWRPIVVSPLDPRRLVSGWGLQVLLSEALWVGVPVLLIVLSRLAVQHARRPSTPGA